MSSPTAFNTQSKIIIRTKWAKPLLAYLQNCLGKKLVYVGLPSEDALDIVTWIEHLDKIYAFVCREYGKPHNPAQSRDGILALQTRLREFERRRQLSGFEVYDGYLEEVVLRGSDNSPIEQPLSIKDVITIYNLDYCNGLSSPITFVNALGNHQKAYKINAIKKLIDIQAGLTSTRNKRFVLFLTLHSSYNQQNPKDFDGSLPAEFDEYLDAVKHLERQVDQEAHIVKAQAFYCLRNFFLDNHFLPEFLPVIRYLGDSGAHMLVVTVIGTDIGLQPSIPKPLQSTDAFLSGPFISIDKSGNFINNNQLTEYSKAKWENIDPIDLFCATKTFAKHWKL